MKELKIISSILCATILLVGCGSKPNSTQTKPITQEQESTVETKEEVVEEPAKESETEIKAKVKKQLDKLQPGVFKSEQANSMSNYKYVYYEDLYRYSQDYVGSKIHINGTITNVNTNDDGTTDVFIYDEILGVSYCVYYENKSMTENVIQGDEITIYGTMEGLVDVTSTNVFGTESNNSEPLVKVDFILNNVFKQACNALDECLKNKPELYGYVAELAGTDKDFEDLNGKRGYVFALKRLENGVYDNRYVFAERGGILRYYTPTVDGININGEKVSLYGSALWGAQ